MRNRTLCITKIVKAPTTITTSLSSELFALDKTARLLSEVNLLRTLILSVIKITGLEKCDAKE